MGNVIQKVFLPSRHVQGNTSIRILQPIDTAHWVWHPDVRCDDVSCVEFSITFSAIGETLRFHVSADQRYELFLDGERISRGPDRSHPEYWTYASYEATLVPGEHTITAFAWNLQMQAPGALLTDRPGFIFKAEGVYDELLTTGTAPWTVRPLSHVIPFENTNRHARYLGAFFEIHSRTQRTPGPESLAVTVRDPIDNKPYGTPKPGWKLFPSTMPDQVDRPVTGGRCRAVGERILADEERIDSSDEQHAEIDAWTKLIRNQTAITIAPNSKRFVVWDLENYWCGYADLRTLGGAGARVQWMWTEAFLAQDGFVKKNRDEIIGKFFSGVLDVFHPGGEEDAFSTPWWRSARYILLQIETADTPLTITHIGLNETRYPLETEARFSADDPDLPAIQELCIRGQQSCSHESYIDCPFYEQLMYVGDTRIEMLTTYCMTHDDRLPRRCLELFDWSRINWGTVNERFPARDRQQSITFSMIWALMLRDYSLYQRNGEWLRHRLPGLRSMLAHLEPFRNADGLLDSPPGWSFMDWVDGWPAGTAPDAETGVSSLVNLFYILALQAAADVEDQFHETLLAQRYRQQAAHIGAVLRETFWNEQHGLLADTLAQDSFSQHAQILGLLSGVLDGECSSRAFHGLLFNQDLKIVTSYFAFYLLEAYRLKGRGDLIIRRLDQWREMLKLGCKTPLEMNEPSRSDCHAWSSHPLFHLPSSIAGIRPASPGFHTVHIAPLPGAWTQIDTAIPHPDGEIALAMQKENETWNTTITLPGAVTGVIEWRGESYPISAGKHTLPLPLQDEEDDTSETKYRRWT